MKNLFPGLLLLCFLLVNCQNKHHHHGKDHNHSNVYMNKKGFENLVANFESEERISWQKPDAVIQLFGDLQGKTIIDIGAGTGYFSFRLAEKGAKVIAADVDERFQNYIKEKKAQVQDTLIDLRLTKFDDPLLEQEEVHHAIIVNSYHHIDHRTNYFKKVHAGLKEKGVLMVVDYKKEQTEHGPPQNHRIPPQVVVKELKAAGYTTIEVNEALLDYQYIIMAYKD